VTHFKKNCPPRAPSLQINFRKFGTFRGSSVITVKISNYREICLLSPM
jgi:hypothetical protein